MMDTIYFIFIFQGSLSDLVARQSPTYHTNIEDRQLTRATRDRNTDVKLNEQKTNVPSPHVHSQNCEEDVLKLYKNHKDELTLEILSHKERLKNVEKERKEILLRYRK